MKEYEYHGYIIKTVRRDIGFGLAYAIYKDDQLLAYEDHEKRAKQFVDWHLQNGRYN